jgi:NAD(P)-dependent dehydrogenase (short-subunit alcohol dehydrogenase family)/acyl carrier protein
MAEVQTGTKPKAATLLTGFETPLGRSAAQALARAGHRLCVVRSDGAAAELGLGELPGHERLQHQGIAADLSDPAAVQRVAQEAAARLGQITALLHVPPPALEPAPEGLDAQRFALSVQRGAGAFLGLGLALLPEMFATQTGSLCVLTSAPPSGGTFRSSEVGAGALLGALLGAVAQLADRCAGTPLRSFLLHTSEPGALAASAQTALLAQLADLGELPLSKRSAATALIENGARASLVVPGLRGRIELLSAPVAAAAPLPLAAAEVARSSNGAHAGNGASAAAPDRIAERVGQIFRSVFGLAAGVDLAGCVVGSVPRWDSLGHLKLMMEIERSLRVRLPAEALAKIQSYRDLEQAVRAQLSTP